nr:acyltransferase [Microbacterium terricola]
MDRLVDGIRRSYWRLRTDGVGTGSRLASTVRIRAPRYVSIGARCVLNDFVHIWGAGGVEIGDDTLIAAHSVISSQSHDIDALAAGSLYRETAANARVVIGRNVWIASNVVIGPGVTVGDNAVIGAGSVVLKDVPPGTLVAGVPARAIRALQ